MERPLAGATVILEFKSGFPHTRYRSGSPRASRKRLPDELQSAAHLIGEFAAGRAVARAQIARLLPKSPPFHAACWRAALTIPVGETRTYQWLAAAAGRPRAHRAAAAAMARNPLAPLVPCHRVVSATGLGGFCGTMAQPGDRNPAHWALAMKLRLLENERTRR